MTPSEKHKAAADHLLLDLADSTCGCGECRDIIARAVAQAERDGMKSAAEICELRAVQWDEHVDDRIPAFLKSHRQRIMADEVRSIRDEILSEAGDD